MTRMQSCSPKRQGLRTVTVELFTFGWGQPIRKETLCIELHAVQLACCMRLARLLLELCCSQRYDMCGKRVQARSAHAGCAS